MTPTGKNEMTPGGGTPEPVRLNEGLGLPAFNRNRR